MRCVVAGCGNFPKRFQIHQTPFHCFPKNPELCKLWLLAIRYPGYDPNTPIDATQLRCLRVCSKHFARSDYPETAGYKPHLRPGSVPTVFPWSTQSHGSTQHTGSSTEHTGAEATDHDAATASSSAAGPPQEKTTNSGCQCDSLDMCSCSSSHPNELMLNSKAIPVMPEQCTVSASRSTDHSYAVTLERGQAQDLNTEKLQHLPMRGKYLYVVDEDCLEHNCPLCGSSCRLEKILHGSLLIITQQCPQCEYCNQWKSQPHSYSPTADGQEQTVCTELTGQQAVFPGDTPGCSSVPHLITEITFSDESDSPDEQLENRVVAGGEHRPDSMWGPLEQQHTDSEPTDSDSDTEEEAQINIELCQVCPDCGMSFNILEPHTCEHKIKPYHCNVCGKRFARKPHLKAHGKIHKGGFKHVCKFCLSTFKRTQDKLEHERGHPPAGVPISVLTVQGCFPGAKRPYQCPDCPEVFSRSKERNDHLLRHSGPKKRICYICNKEYPNTRALRRHMAIHTEARQFVCDLCGRSFKQSGHLKSHMRVHTLDKPVRCQYCNKHFNNNVSLKSHMQRYHGQISDPGMKMKNCHMCNMEFPTTSALERHVVMHTHAKQFVCQVCHRSFSQAGHLKSHMRIHTGEKPYECQHCDKSFNHNVSLKSHIQRYHGQVNDPGMKAQLEKTSRNESEVDTDDTNEMDNIAVGMAEAAGSKDTWCNLLDDEEKRGTKVCKNRFAGKPKGKPKRNAVISWAEMEGSSDSASDSADEEEKRASKKMKKTTWRSKGRPKNPPGGRTKKKVGSQTYKGTGGRRGRPKKNALV